ncbi:MAG: hypothetical protein J6386_11265 [Candidatus Synoicihabitans palmerolidicus]|nr:hypothetical protein [Candidatus Synoicihabitans palmerolidicus]
MLTALRRRWPVMRAAEGNASHSMCSLLIEEVPTNWRCYVAAGLSHDTAYDGRLVRVILAAMCSHRQQHGMHRAAIPVVFTIWPQPDLPRGAFTLGGTRCRRGWNPTDDPLGTAAGIGKPRLQHEANVGERWPAEFN